MSEKGKTVAVVGAAGRIGDAACHAFLDAGWTVIGIGRGARMGEMAHGVVPVSADASDSQALSRACAGADVILNALNPEYDNWTGTVLPMADSVLAAAEVNGATILLPGNVYNFGAEVGMAMREDAPESPSTEKARIRIALEAKLRKAALEKGTQSIVLRAGDFYGGKKAGSWLDLMIASKLRQGIFTWPGPSDLPHAFAYLPDLARAFVKVAEARGKLDSFESLHFAGHTLKGREMHHLTEQAVGRKLKLAGVPWMLVRALGLVKPLYREIAIMSYLWRTAHSLDGAKLARWIGPFEETPPGVAVRQAIADLSLDDRVERAAA